MTKDLGKLKMVSTDLDISTKIKILDLKRIVF